MIHSDDIIFDKEKAQKKETIHKTNHRKRKLTEEQEVNTTEVTFVFSNNNTSTSNKDCMGLKE